MHLQLGEQYAFFDLQEAVLLSAKQDQLQV
jgi:hypothetical protein